MERKPKRTGIGIDRLSVHPLLGVQSAQLEIVLRQRGFHAQARGGHIGGAGLEPRLARLDRAPDLAPQIGLPTDRAAGSELIRRAVISDIDIVGAAAHSGAGDRSRGRSEEHTSELQSLMRTSYAVFC